MQLPDILLLLINFRFCIFQLFEDLESSFVGAVDFLFELYDVIRGILVFSLEVDPRGPGFLLSDGGRAQLILEVLAAEQFLLL